MKRRNDGRYQKSVVIDGVRKYFYGNSQREINEKVKEYIRSRKEREVNGEKFEDVAGEWHRTVSERLSPTTVKGYEPHYKRGVEAFSGRYIKDIKTKEVSAFVNGLGLSKKTARNQLSVLSQIFEYAIINCGLDSNPCSHVTITQGTKPEHRRSLTADEVALIEANSDGMDGLFRNTLLFTGLRRGEILALQYKDVDRKRSVITVSKSVYFQGNTPYLKEPKTQAGIRSVLLVDRLAKLIPEGPAKHFIFSDDGGKTPMHNKSSATLWNRYAKRIGLEGITPHYLRHNYATMLYQSGVDVKTAQFLLGHSDISTTMNVYTHISNEMLADALAKLNNS